MRVLSLFALAAPLVSAIQFVEPIANSTLKKGETYSVKWNSVDTDPSTFSIYLVNFVDWPPFYTQVAYDVPTSSGEHEVTVPCDVSTSWGFQFNAINGTNVYVIHAQTGKFSVRDGACSGSAPSPVSSSIAPTCTAETVTVTETASCTAVLSQAASASTASASSVKTDSASRTASTPVSAVTASDVPAQPSVTTPPAIQHAATKSEITSTVYSTLYLDMSEVDECVLCKA